MSDFKPALPLRTIVINPIGVPGCGKTTFCLGLCHTLKLRGVQAVMVPEVLQYEMYDSAAMARVRSGRFDQRFLRRQYALTRPLAGRVEVIVNDGALEPFLYYAGLRMPPDRLVGFRQQLDEYRQQLAGCDHRFLTLERYHDYQAAGRMQAEPEARRTRRDLLSVLESAFRIRPALIMEHQRAPYTEALIADVMAMPHRPRVELRLQKETPGMR